MYGPRVQWIYEGRNPRCLPVVHARRRRPQWGDHQAPPWLKLSEMVIDKLGLDDPHQAAKGTENCGGGS